MIHVNSKIKIETEAKNSEDYTKAGVPL